MASLIPWWSAADELVPHVVRISTPRGHGTGFLFTHAANGTLSAVATAAHVVQHAFAWEDPIRLDHVASGRTAILHSHERAVFLREKEDSAAVLFAPPKDMFPSAPRPLIAEEKCRPVGSEIAWFGFPAVAPNSLCFFHGHISALVEPERRYLVDGVAINGVSGGPAVAFKEKGSEIIGIVTAYLPNWVEGGTLPGLCIVQHIGALHEFIRSFASLGEAKSKEEKPEPKPTAGPGEKAGA
jgi:hypothetical protein